VTRAERLVREYPDFCRRRDNLRRTLDDYIRGRDEIILRRMGVSLDTETGGRQRSGAHADPTAAKAMALAALGDRMLGTLREYEELARELGIVDAVLPEGSGDRELMRAWHWRGNSGMRAATAVGISPDAATARWRRIVARVEAELRPLR
jgi:hypothetical protein